MFYTRSLKFFWQRTKRLQAHQILSLYTLSTLILYTVYDLKDFYATPDWWSSAWSSASCFLLPAEYHTVCPYTPNLRKSEYIIWSVLYCSGNVRMRSWANNKQKETARPSLCVFQAQISLDTMWRRLISACFSNTLEFKLSNFQNRGCVATSYNETLRNKSKEKVWRQWIELIMLLVTEGTFNVLYLINIIPWRDLASVTINRHTRLDLIVVGSSEKSFFDCLCHFSFVLWVELRERSRKPLLCSLRENKNHRWKKHLSWFRSISRSSLRVKQLGRPFPHRSPRYDFDWHGIPFAYTN